MSGFSCCRRRFTLIALHEAILGKALDKRNFRRKVLGLGLVKPSKEMQAAGRKPAELFSFREPM